MKRKKNRRFRGSKTHGHGSMKKWRGAGHRGGRGNAGSGKRADTKKPSNWKKRYFGRYGFTSKSRTPSINAVNILYLEEQCNTLLDNKKIKKEGDVYTIDLPSLGYNKLLSRGKLKKKFKITVSYASKKAIQVVEEAGGKVVGLKE